MNRDELLQELQEQARLVGMGAERELALKAQIDRLKRVNAEMLEACQEALDVLADLQGGCTDSDDGTVEALTIHCPEVINNLLAAIAKARGEK